ncbi:helix-turn-helix domain-containing protein [Cytobacillus horneckiae]|uniref:helix-turn-helix domain-containing protein n=1 Tax=Cytobacillus horneckiae TaxID=549687 RepID=UPI003D1C6CD8
MGIGERIKEKRKELKMTQTELSRLVNVSSQVISNWERAYTHPNHEDVAKLAEALQCSTEYLHGRTVAKITGKENKNTTVAGKEIFLSPEEIRMLEELKKHPNLFHDLSTNPEKKIKELIKLQKAKKLLFEDDDEELGEGFGELED